MITNADGHRTNFETIDDFLDAFLTDGGQIIVFKYEYQFFPPLSWAPEKSETETQAWNRICGGCLSARHQRTCGRCGA